MVLIFLLLTFELFRHPANQASQMFLGLERARTVHSLGFHLASRAVSLLHVFLDVVVRASLPVDESPQHTLGVPEEE